VDEHLPTLSADELSAARALTRRGTRGTYPLLIGLVAIAAGAAGAIVAAIAHDADVLVTALACGGVGAVVATPLIIAVMRYATKRGVEMSIETIRRERALESDARRRDFETRLSRALEMVDDEQSAFDVLRRAMTLLAPDRPMELLLADNSHAHLERVVVATPEGSKAPGCAVDSPDLCVAARRAQTQVFADSEALDACPMLRGREVGRCSGVCVPVSIMGRTVGVLHAIAEPGDVPSDDDVQALQTLADQSGNRLGMLRMMAETQLQASTDGLTGLMNRRNLENAMRRLNTEGVPFSLVVADLDHFKVLNDTHGHEAGDRALRIFSKTLRASIRADDLACRYGGEEFAIVLPESDVPEALEVVERVRASLARAIEHGEAPPFTASYGIAHSTDAADLEDLFRRADQAMFAAKAAGRDCACLDGHTEAVAHGLTALA